VKMFEKYPAKDYLGDGVYVQVSDCDGSLILTTENGLFTTNSICLEPAVYHALIRFCDRVSKVDERYRTK